VLLTAVSDLEVLSEEEPGSLWHIRYPYVQGAGHVVVATTRPETLLGDTAVAVSPDDPRYQALIGARVQLPLTGRTIPVIADSYVDAAFGSGAVKITPAHDFNDYEVGLRHSLQQINIFTPMRSSIENAPAAIRGLDRFEARKLVVARSSRRTASSRDRAAQTKVPRGDPYRPRDRGISHRPSGTVKIGPLAEPALRAVEDGASASCPKTGRRPITSGCAYQGLCVCR
jgi:valyl-tRNA synthetase